MSYHYVKELKEAAGRSE